MGAGDTRAFAIVAGVMVVAGGLAAAVNSAAPFEHGSWLAAYLVLVAGMAQLGLGAGRAGLPAPRRRSRRPWVQLVQWNAGNAAVVAGVFAGAPALVTAGSVALLVSLAWFAVDAGPRRPGGRARVVLYHALVVGLAIGVVVGSALADAPPGRWI